MTPPTAQIARVAICRTRCPTTDPNGIDPDDHELWDSLLAMMVNDADEAKAMITLMKQKSAELNDE